MDVESVLAALNEFTAEREWEQFHTTENLAKSISIESGELLECFQWGSNPARERVIDELADVLTYSLLLAQRLGVEPMEIVMDKLGITQEKYPVDRARGTSAKYDELSN